MHPHDLIRIRHMLDAGTDAMSFAAGRTRADLDKDRQLLLSIVKSLSFPCGQVGLKESAIH